MDLAHEYKVSRTIVREVLKHFDLEGLIDLVPYKGTNVAKRSVKEVDDVYRIQQGFEDIATKLMSTKQIEELEQIHHYLTHAPPRGGCPCLWLEFPPSGPAGDFNPQAVTHAEYTSVSSRRAEGIRWPS